MDGQNQTVTVVVIAMYGAEHLIRCLDALDHQQSAPPFSTLVVYDPALTGMDAVASRYPAVRLVSNEHQHTPLQLVSRALAEVDGDLILLTKDHCAADANWVRAHVDARRRHPDAGAVGGVMRTERSASALDWAVFFLDFFRYLEPMGTRQSASLTVCNVSYRRSQLAVVRSVWDSIYHETAVHDALRDRFGPLYITPGAVVTTRRRVRFARIVRERYALGRSFGATRLAYASAARRIGYVLCAPVVPLLVLTRMSAAVLRKPQQWVRLVRGFAYVVVLLCAWAVGEWIGSITARRPRSFSPAGEAA